MNRSLYISILCLFAILILSTCAQRGGREPLGITGGSHGGYGYSRDYYRDYLNGNSRSSNDIYGVWSDNDITVNLNTNGTFHITSAEEIRVGTFSILNNILTLNFKDGTILSYSYALTKDRLMLEEIE